MLDLLIQGGIVVDGTGSATKRADVAVQDGRIAGVGLLPGAEATATIDARECVVAPGFIDMHSHADFTLPLNPTADSLVHQGITTVVAGQCGMSPAPLLEGTRDQVAALMETEILPLPWREWSSVAEYLAYVARDGISLNLVSLVGHGTVRGGVMGLVADPPDQAQEAAMAVEVERAMAVGAAGISTGLIYPPGFYASTEELITLMRPVAARDRLYFSHIRGEGDTLLEAVAEAIRVGRETGASVQISHLKAAGRDNWPKIDQALVLIEAAQAEGLDVTADVYPYVAGSTTLAAMLPEWSQEGGKTATLARLADPQERGRIINDMRASGEFRNIEWENVLISDAPSQRHYQGRTIADLADAAGQDPCEWTLSALLEAELEISMVLFDMSEENLRVKLQHPATMIGTDALGRATEGPLSEGVPHPREYGTYPRVLGRYVREQKLLTLEEAVWKMTGFPAQKLGWTDRGLVKAGHVADLVVFDPEKVVDQATFAEPHQYPIGVQHVLVNGKSVVHLEQHTGARPGRIL